MPDVTAPSAPASLAPADGTVTALARPAFSWTAAADAQSGVTGYELRVDGATVATADAGSTSAIPDAALAEGRHTWNVVAVDGFGNESASAPRTLVIDSTPPGAPVPLTPAAGAGRTVGPGGLHLAAPRATTSAGWRATASRWTGRRRASAPRSTGARVRLTAGRHSWRVVALDVAGNAAPGPARWVILRPAPRVTLSTPTIVRLGTRPVLRVRLTRTARVVFRVRPSTGTGPSSRFVSRLRSGRTAVRLPRTVARRLRPGLAYRVSAQPMGGSSQEHAHQRHRPLTAHPTRQPMSRVVPCRITYTGRARRGWNTMEASSPSLRASSCGRRRKLTELTSPSSSRNSPS